MNTPDPASSETNEAPPTRVVQFENATSGDIILSVIVPGWGVLVGIIALIKGETRRGWTMIGISVALIATIKMLSSYLGD